VVVVRRSWCFGRSASVVHCRPSVVVLRRVGDAVVGGVVYSRHKFPAGLWRRREVEFGELWWS
jgi:hypothetical protein